MIDKLGCHVGNSGDEMLVGSVNEALSYNANCLMLYLGAPQNTIRKPMSQFRIPEYLQILKENNIDPADVIIHGPYILNFAQPDPLKRDFAVEFMSEEVKKANQMGAKYVVFHPGAHVNQGSEAGCNLIALSIKRVLDNTKDVPVTLLLETMAGKGSECGCTFEEVAYILNRVNNERLKVCLDTCHIFDGGYDIVNDYEKVMDKLDMLIGIKNIKCIHCNDSKNVLGSHKDRHENIGFGNIGFDTLLKVCSDPRFQGIPKILETPYVDKEYPPFKYEIAMLRSGKFDPSLIDKIKEQA